MLQISLSGNNGPLNHEFFIPLHVLFTVAMAIEMTWTQWAEAAN